MLMNSSGIQVWYTLKYQIAFIKQTSCSLSEKPREDLGLIFYLMTESLVCCPRVTNSVQYRHYSI